MSIDLSHQLYGRRLTLRRLKSDDTYAVHTILSDWRVARTLQRAAKSPAHDDICSWLSRHETDWMAGCAYRFGVTYEARLIGCADIDGIGHGGGELGYWFERASWGQGFGSEAARLVRNFAIGHLGLVQLRAGHAIENIASGRILLGLGFQEIGNEVLYYPAQDEELPYRRYVFDSIQHVAAQDESSLFTSSRTK